MNLIQEEEGIIFEQEGLTALFLSLITGQGIKFKTKPMFVLRNGNIEPYYMLHHFYRWYAQKSNLPGFDFKTQQKFKQFLIDNSDEAVKNSQWKIFYHCKKQLLEIRKQPNLY